ncbi:DNA-3-methyladenine glycosylase [Actinospongicola halichondriae]|uniref:DNA-3-methyladenine glycosylase n=1 Tax=Actinospongicola halichondriae TaxID=3236844 RepID=UPI003D409D53
MSGRLDRTFFARDPRDVGPDLLGMSLVHDRPGDRRVGRIVEVEAYCGDQDAAAHTFRGRTPRNETMFGPGGLLYVYFSYGVHWCANVVCGAEGHGVAVLIRALAPIEGVDAMYVSRGAPARRDRDLCSGPGKLTQAMAIDGAHDGVDLTADEHLYVVDDEAPVGSIVQTTRVGISVAVDEPWRWYLDGDPNVSRR